MKSSLELSTNERLALRRLANERGLSLDEAAAAALRDWLISNGYLELEHELAADAETAGNA
ncbi:hypothetical protein C7441_112138 [Pseudaminobacter salicylatoxidans]|uniref:Uncharacterized protein n=1 Tax=Pseudaminobacter salicylatoxidans TaxID=93369 RepID=A0A316BZT8_PSESE|nr:hypothetical protein [Pseudaminobacter salicylatoxidans]PWJ80596.1 hypothetical protein C7441_112138 [Pseudaminobacter salicylatoxidans]